VIHGGKREISGREKGPRREGLKVGKNRERESNMPHVVSKGELFESDDYQRGTTKRATGGGGGTSAKRGRMREKEKVRKSYPPVSVGSYYRGQTCKDSVRGHNFCKIFGGAKKAGD